MLFDLPLPSATLHLYKFFIVRWLILSTQFYQYFENYPYQKIPTESAALYKYAAYFSNGCHLLCMHKVYWL